MNPGKARSPAAVKFKKRKSFDESFPGQRTLDSMLGAAPRTSGDLHAPVNKSKGAARLPKDQMKKKEHPKSSSSYPRRKDVCMTFSDFQSVKVVPKTSANPPRVKERQPKAPIVKRERDWPRPTMSSPPKRHKVVDLTQSPITKYISLSPAKRKSAPSEQPEKKSIRPPPTNGFVSITDASTRHLSVRSFPSSPMIDLTHSHDSSPIDLCSTSSSSFGSRTSTPKSSGLTSPWERFSISASDISTSSSAHSSNSVGSKPNLPECEDYIPLDTPRRETSVESPRDAKVPPSLCQLGRAKTTPVRLYARAKKVLSMPPDVYGSVAEQMDVSVLNLDALKKDLGLEFEQWCNNPEDDLRALAAERLIHMERAPSSTPVEVVPLSGCHVKECLDTSLPFRATLALEEALLLLSSSSRMPSAQVMAVICEKVILAEGSTQLQRGTGCGFLHKILDQCPPGRSELARQVYVDTFKQFGRLPQCRKVFGGPMQALVAMMIPSGPSLLVLQWMNNVLLSDLLSCTHSTSPVPPLVSGLGAGLRHALKAIAQAVSTKDERNPVTESLLEECLVTVQLYVAHLLMRQGSIDSVAEQLSSELLEAGVHRNSPSLNCIYPLQLRKAVMNHLTIKMDH